MKKPSPLEIEFRSVNRCYRYLELDVNWMCNQNFEISMRNNTHELANLLYS